jgi:hypothetical protein
MFRPLLGCYGRQKKLLRHLLATLAYRTQKALRDAPDSFASFQPAPQVRTPNELTHHMDSLMGYARTFFIGGEYQQEMLPDFTAEILRLHATIADVARHLKIGTPFHGITPERMLQGPFTDAMTHVGQKAMLRRLADSPVPPENFIYADVRPDNLGPDHPVPVRPGNRRGELDEGQ